MPVSSLGRRDTTTSTSSSRDPEGAVLALRRPRPTRCSWTTTTGDGATGYNPLAPERGRTCCKVRRPESGSAKFSSTRASRARRPSPSWCLWDLRSFDRLVYRDTRRLTHTGDERTAFRFTIDHAATSPESHIRRSASLRRADPADDQPRLSCVASSRWRRSRPRGANGRRGRSACHCLPHARAGPRRSVAAVAARRVADGARPADGSGSCKRRPGA